MSSQSQKFWKALETRGFVKGPSHGLVSLTYCERISTLTFSFSFEKNDTLKCFSCSANNYSFEELICTLHSVPSVKEEEKELMHAYFGDVVRLYHSYHIFIVFI